MLGPRRFPILALAVLGPLACAPPNPAKPYPTTAPPVGEVAEPAPPAEPSEPEVQALTNYFERSVDLAPFLAGFPYGRFKPSLETGRVFFYRLGEDYQLRMLEVDGEKASWSLDEAKVISDVDWSKRSLWSIHHHADTDTLWLHADASNDEQMNLWTLSLADGKLQQVTQHDYVYGLGFSEDESQIAYLPRKGKQAPFETCLRIRDVKTGDEREVVCDSEKLTFTWSSPRFTPDGNEVYFDAQVQGDRNRVQIVRVDLSAKKPKPQLVTDPKRPRNSPELLEGWLGDELLYVSNEDGYANLWAHDRKTGKTRQITRFTEDVTSAELTDGKVIGIHRTPAGSTLFMVDPETGAILDERKLPGTADVADAHGGRAYLYQTAPDVVYEAYDLDMKADAFGAFDKVIALDTDLEDQIVQCKATAVKIPTFDEVDGQPRMLHAFLLEPKQPIADPKQRLAMITAFYGGSNRYDRFDNIMCAAGMTVLSPAVRGSSGFGKAFYSLNDKDLGGDEIIDLFYAARWLEEHTGLHPRRIGVKGGSHGGYATMRALTFPPETNGRNESYPLGFGMSHAGFSDIKSFYDQCNIPDWVVLESGDPKVPAELERMKDRSPLTHVERLRAPLLLTHGSQDWRVPVQESRAFAEAAKKLELPVNYVEIAGQGHHIEGLDLQAQTYQARFDFLQAVAEAAPVQGEGEAKGEGTSAKE